MSNSVWPWQLANGYLWKQIILSYYNVVNNLHIPGNIAIWNTKNYNLGCHGYICVEA